MTREALREIVVGALMGVAPEVDPQTIRSDAPLRDQVDLDSMDFLKVLVGFHDRLGIDIPESDYAKLSSLDAIVSYLSTRLGPGST